MLDEPTRGIDVGAKYEIYQLIIDLAKRGKVVLMVSSEMPELLGVCDRILVMSGEGWRRGGCKEYHAGGNHGSCRKICLEEDTCMNPTKMFHNKIGSMKQGFANYKSLDSRDKKTFWKEFLLNNALYILLIIAIIYTYIQNHNFLGAPSIVNIISLSAANLPIAVVLRAVSC